MSKHTEEFAPSPLAVMITSVYMPETGVSTRTEATRRIGAHALLVHLMQGDWGNYANSANYEEFLAEFIQRVSDNAQRQGIELPKAELQSRDVPSYIPYDISNCTLGEFGIADEDRKSSWDRTAKSLAEIISELNDIEIFVIVHKLGLYYGRHLISEGVSGQELLAMVEDFEAKQFSIMQNLVATQELRQPDQDDHTFQHYLDDLTRVVIHIRD